MILKFNQWLNESAMPSKQDRSKLISIKNPDGRKMLEEFSENLKDLGFPAETEETGTMNYNTQMPTILLDIVTSDIGKWKVKLKKANTSDEKHKLMDFLLELDDNFFGEEEATLDKVKEKYSFWEIEASEKIEAFANHWGYVPHIIGYITFDEDDWMNIIVTFMYDEKIAHTNRGRITGKKFQF